MDVIVFICVSLGSSRIQLHDSLCSRHACAYSKADFSSQNGDRAWGVYSRRAKLFYDFYVQNDSLKRMYIKKKSLFKVRSVCGVKRFITGSRKVANILLMTKLKRSCGSGWDNSQKLLRCGFRRAGKAMGQVYQCWWRMCREINVFSRLEYHMFYVLYCHM
jgi:hypothetical protein